MKLLHHSQGYNQYTFIQKYRNSHISHSGVNRHWSIMWSLMERGNTWRYPTCPSQQPEWESGWAGGQQKGRHGHFLGGVGHMARCRSGTEVKTGACSEQQPLCVCVCVPIVTTAALPAAAFTHHQHLKTSAQQATLDQHTSSRGRSGALCCIHQTGAIFCPRQKEGDLRAQWAQAGTALCILSCISNTETQRFPSVLQRIGTWWGQDWVGFFFCCCCFASQM